MVRPAPIDYLQPDEEVILQTGRHGLSVLDEAIVACVLAAIPITAVLVLAVGFIPSLILPLAVPVVAAVATLLGIFLLTRFWRVKTSVYIITGERVYKAHGRIRFFGAQTTYDKLTDMQVKQSLFGRWGGFGTVRLETAGTGIQLEGVRDPFGFKQQVEDARASFIRMLVGEKPKNKASKSAAPQAPDAPIWNGRISGPSLLSSLISVGVFILGGVVALVASIAFPPIAAMGAVLVAVGLLLGAGILVRYKFTHFQVGSRGVVITSGWLTRRRVETTYEKVTDVTVFQGILGRVLDFGTITINTAGSNAAPVIFQGVHRPETVKEIIDEARRASEAR